MRIHLLPIVPAPKVKLVSFFYFIVLQGANAYTCWAFSCASMIRVSCKLIIKQSHECGIIDDGKKERCLKLITSEKVHVEIRNLAMMILLPRKLHVDDETQSAFLRAAVSRVLL